VRLVAEFIIQSKHRERRDENSLHGDPVNVRWSRYRYVGDPRYQCAARSGSLAIVDIGEVTDPNLFKTLGPKAGPANEAFGGKFIVRTETITALDGTPPKRIVVIAFDSIEKAKAWDASPAQKEVTDIRLKSTKSRSLIADGKIM
jgi:uncharacterized protein (DUF1330 family)